MITVRNIFLRTREDEKTMSKIFISWSGKTTSSFQVATVIHSALKLVFQNHEFFFSDHIQKGTFGVQQIFENLSEAKIGIFCVTKANILKPWLNFEAGALSCAVMKNNGCAIPLLIDMTKDEFAASPSPLAKFQAVCLNDSDDILRMLNDISNAISAGIPEKDMEKYYIRLVKPELDGIDITVSEELNDEPIPINNIILSDSLTKDAKKFLKILYKDYDLSRAIGLSRAESVSFPDSEQQSEKFKMDIDDINELSLSLMRLGYLECIYDDDNIVYQSKLTDKGIKYGEDNFDEPSYILLLREIIKQYNSRGASVPSDRFKNYSSSDFSVLKSKGFINTTVYLNGNFVVKPTDSGIAEISLRDE